MLGGKSGQILGEAVGRGPVGVAGLELGPMRLAELLHIC